MCNNLMKENHTTIIYNHNKNMKRKKYLQPTIKKYHISIQPLLASSSAKYELIRSLNIDKADNGTDEITASAKDFSIWTTWDEE